MALIAATQAVGGLVFFGKWLVSESWHNVGNSRDDTRPILPLYVVKLLLPIQFLECKICRSQQKLHIVIHEGKTANFHGVAQKDGI